jgi:ribosomal protein S18 acetylase RimI-like enzyme
VPALSRSLCRAFFHDPVTEYLFPNEARRARRLEKYFSFEMRALFLRRGESWTSAGLEAAAFWVPPRQSPPTLAELLAQLPVMWMFGRHLTRGHQLVQLLEAQRPRAPHHYLATIGTDPAEQGKGYGSALLRVVLERCDADGVPSYVESSNESNLSFYRRHGYELVGDVVVPGTPVKLWLMWREPVPVNGRLPGGRF